MSADTKALEAGVLLEEAQRQTGLDDLGGDSVLEGLGVYCDALASQAKLNDLGVAALPAIVLTNLTNRLRVVEHLKQHPSVADEPIDAPVRSPTVPPSASPCSPRTSSRCCGRPSPTSRTTATG